MVFDTILRKINRLGVGVQTDLAVYTVRVLTGSRDGDANVRLSMEVVADFMDRHPWQVWNPLFVFNKTLRDELYEALQDARREWAEPADLFPVEPDFHKDDKWEPTPITVADIDELRRKIFASAKANGYIGKPATLEDLIKRIESLPAQDIIAMGDQS